jgi:hypothetical protein
MTELLEKAFAEAAKLPEEEQRRLAEWLLIELSAERRWEALLANSSDSLERLAEEALREHRAGRTEPLDPDQL